MSYRLVSGHRDMVLDQVRNAAYQRAIQSHVGANSVVLDLGAGLGLHALMAARAGAARVYVVEPAPVCSLAREIALANGLAERMVFLQGKAEDLELPEKVDVLLSVFTGNLLYSEDLLPVLFEARDRFLRPGGVMLPDQAELWGVPVSDTMLQLEHSACWSGNPWGFDFSAARRFATNELYWLQQAAPRGQRLADAVPLTTLDLTSASSGDCDCEVEFRMLHGGSCHGVLAWIRFRLASDWLSTDPLEPAMHWSNAVFPLDPPLEVEAGELLRLRLQRPRGGDWTWIVRAGSDVRRHSTFLARLDNRHRLEAASGNSSVIGTPEP